jgi:carbamoyltransferase
MPTPARQPAGWVHRPGYSSPLTGRLHTVQRSQNQVYCDLIKAFARKTGIPVVLNASFNENEPIVDTPSQAVNCFVRTDMDVLCLGPFVTVKQGIHLKG